MFSLSFPRMQPACQLSNRYTLRHKLSTYWGDLCVIVRITRIYRMPVILHSYQALMAFAFCLPVFTEFGANTQKVKLNWLFWAFGESSSCSLFVCRRSGWFIAHYFLRWRFLLIITKLIRFIKPIKSAPNH